MYGFFVYLHNYSRNPAKHLLRCGNLLRFVQGNFISVEIVTPYLQLGEAEGVRRLVDTFYDLMETLPEAKGILKLHPEDLSRSREKLFMFLSGWLGGPQLYMEAYGHPRLRARHLPFPIGRNERDAWLLCMDKALEQLGVDKSLHFQLMQAFQPTANHLRNDERADLVH